MLDDIVIEYSYLFPGYRELIKFIYHAGGGKATGEAAPALI